MAATEAALREKNQVQVRRVEHPSQSTDEVDTVILENWTAGEELNAVLRAQPQASIILLSWQQAALLLLSDANHSLDIEQLTTTIRQIYESKHRAV